MESLTIDVSTVQLTDEQFYHLCRQNESLRFEMTAKGELLVMPAVGGITGNRESTLCAMVWNWNETTGLGVTFSSSTIVYCERDAAGLANQSPGPTGRDL
jgi:Uma2 family endonuclease